jgi:triacylglycerol esterase/lipase EstA (alpha/beta hydrolase family)
VIRRATVAAGVAASAAVVAGTGCIATNAPSMGPTSGKQPIVFVHGYTMQNLNMWATAKARFQADGYRAGDFHEFNYNSTSENAKDSADKLAPVVLAAAAKSPTGKVDIVAHSEGNLVAETCMVLGPCEGKVDHWVNLSGAQNGTALASAVAVGGGGAAAMNPLSLLVTQLNAKEKASLAQQGVKTIVFYTDTDGIIIPGALSREDFAKIEYFVGTHFTVYLDAGVLNKSSDFLKS